MTHALDESHGSDEPHKAMTTQSAAGQLPCGRSQGEGFCETTLLLAGHEHTPRHPRAHDRSIGAALFRATHSTDEADLMDEIDAQISNWCGTCQRALLSCYRAKCEGAEKDVVTFKYVGIEYALAKAQHDYPRWDAGAEVTARDAADHKSNLVIDMPSTDPGTWEPGFYLSSIVNWIVNWTVREVQSKVGAYLARQSSTPLPNAASNTRDVATEALAGIENALLGEHWQELTGRMLQAVADLPSRGTTPHPPETFLRWYQARYVAWNFHHDGRYSPETKSDRQLAAHLDGVSYPTVSRFRREDLVPALNALRDNTLTLTQKKTLATLRDNPALTHEQRDALAAAITTDLPDLTTSTLTTLSTLHDTPGLHDAHYAAIATLQERATNPLTDQFRASLDIFINYIEGRTIAIDKHGNIHIPRSPDATHEGRTP